MTCQRALESDSLHKNPTSGTSGLARDLPHPARACIRSLITATQYMTAAMALPDDPEQRALLYVQQYLHELGHGEGTSHGLVVTVRRNKNL